MAAVMRVSLRFNFCPFIDLFSKFEAHTESFDYQDSILSSFLFLSPEVRTSVIFVSSPCSLLVVLWGMTSSRMKDMMLKKRRQVGVSGIDGTSLLNNSNVIASSREQPSGWAGHRINV